jgi:tetratricopeptide (TPR) repeat protein
MAGFAYQYHEQKKFDKAKEYYQFVLQNSTDKSLAFKALRKIAEYELTAKNYDVADQAIALLLNDHSENQMLSRVIGTCADGYWGLKKYDKAKTLFQYVAANSSDVERAYNGQLRVMHCEMKLGSYVGAEAAFEKLWKNHSSAKGFVEKATRVCGSILSFETPETVLPYVDRALEVAEDIKTVMMLLQFKAQCHIDLGQSEQAQAVRQQIELYSDKEYYPGVQLALAYVYRKNGQYEKAMEIYNKVLQSSTDDTKKLDAHAGVAAVAISLGNDSDVTASIESLCTNFAGHEMLGWTVFVVGEEYYLKAEKAVSESNKEMADSCYQKAISIWANNITEIEYDSLYKCYAYYFSAISYRYLNDHQKAVKYFEEVASGWPGYDRRWHALSSLAILYEEQLRMNKLSKNAATSKIKNVYQEIVAKYPDSPPSKVAEIWLKEN